jgi:hypothetical protein
MNGFLDDLLVGLVLLASTGYVLYSLGPKTLRLRLLVGMSVLLGRLPTRVGLRGVAERLAMMTKSTGKGACGGCGSCGSETLDGTRPATTQPSTTEVRIPLSKVGRRP